MSLCASIGECFKTHSEPQLAPLRIAGMALGAVILVSAIASAIFQTASAAEVTLTAIIGGSIMAGGALGSIGLVVLPILLLLGVSAALAPPMAGYYVVWI